MGLAQKGRTRRKSPLLSRGGVARSDGVVLIQAIDFLNQPPRRFAAPRLDQGGEFAFPKFLCKAPAWGKLKTVAAIALLP